MTLVQQIPTALARAAWPLVEYLNRRLERPGPQPVWAPGRLMKSRERSFPQLGWPRETDSLCPGCVKEVRAEILSGRRALSELIAGRPGEIRARILERDGQVVMEKNCPRHGPVTDVLSIDPVFLHRIESLHRGRDFRTQAGELRRHGSSSIQYGRGAVLTVDLTNRCNMMCDPCFMDANQVGYVHELTWEDIKKILDASITVKPRRQMSIQFSGGEPTLSPYFLDAIRYARQVGYFAVQCATNGLRFAQEPGFARKAKEAGLRMAYLQFDGIGNEANAHRKISNLFDVKLRAIEELHRAGIDVILVVTVVRGVNDDQIGPILRFAIANSDKITVVSFQPVSFTGRDEDIDDERRAQQRYTLSHLAHDVKAQTGVTEPLRDWFPLSAMGPLSDLTDLLLPPDAPFGAVNCGCHPNCGIGTILFVNKRTKEMVPLSEFLDMEQLLADIQVVVDGAMPRPVALAQTALALMRNFRPERAPAGYGFREMFRQFVSQIGARGRRVGQFESDAREFEWRVLFVAGMWFQDLFNYDFRRTEMCIIPYGTQMGEISFCAYNTGIGWRNIVEKMLQTATVAEWYRRHGRHPVYAKHRDLELPAYDHPLTSTVPDLPGYVTSLNEQGKVRLRVVA
ncbi:MAG: radical SAM protein [Myxococcales bacterium]|nr:radical SAM protein [Myxococcota bacterium]MDW8280503.1 radical SAM protein [Myxococcales bacterium]